MNLFILILPIICNHLRSGTFLQSVVQDHSTLQVKTLYSIQVQSYLSLLLLALSKPFLLIPLHSRDITLNPSNKSTCTSSWHVLRTINRVYTINTTMLFIVFSVYGTMLGQISFLTLHQSVMRGMTRHDLAWLDHAHDHVYCAWLFTLNIYKPAIIFS